MAITNQDRVGKAMDLLKQGLGPFVEREFKNAYGATSSSEVKRILGDDRLYAKKEVVDLDAAALLKVVWDSWNNLFGRTLGRAERSLVQELRDRKLPRLGDKS